MLRSARGLRVAVSFVALAAVAAALPASADGSVPAPTVKITCTLLGQPSSAPTTTGTWTVAQPGQAASLEVKGVNVPTGRTSVVGVWTSHSWRPSKGIAISATWSVAEDGVAVASPEGDWSIQERERHGARGWSAWHGASAPFQSAFGVITTSAAGRSWTEFPVQPREKWQFQFRVRYTTSATGAQTASFAVTTAK